MIEARILLIYDTNLFFWDNEKYIYKEIRDLMIIVFSDTSDKFIDI